MYRLMYLSNSSIELSDKNIDDMVVAASTKNQRLGITGILAFNGNTFLQILEGSQDRVAALMDVIRADHRHNGVTVASELPVENRAYPEWGMHRIDTIDIVALTAYLLDTHFKADMAESAAAY